MQLQPQSDEHEARIREVYRLLAGCLERVADLDHTGENRGVRQMLALLWAAHDTLESVACQPGQSGKGPRAAAPSVLETALGG